MDNLMQIPEWLGAAGIGAVIAALGYVGKMITESWLSFQEAQNARRARLVELYSLLRATRVSFHVQNDHTKNLLSMIRARYPVPPTAEEGFERTFSLAYHDFTPDEKELHTLIRGITIHALRPANLSLVDWLKADTYFKAQKPSQGILGELATKLAVLEAHLILWHAKYEIWIPDTPEHALVYLADEKRHGVGFPSGIDAIVSKALEIAIVD